MDVARATSPNDRRDWCRSWQARGGPLQTINDGRQGKCGVTANTFRASTTSAQNRKAVVREDFLASGHSQSQSPLNSHSAPKSDFSASGHSQSQPVDPWNGHSARNVTNIPNVPPTWPIVTVLPWPIYLWQDQVAILSPLNLRQALQRISNGP